MDYKTLTMKLRVHFAILPMRLERKNILYQTFKKKFYSDFQWQYLFIIITESNNENDDSYESDPVSL